MRIALVSREVHPLCGGGIGRYVAAAAALLAEIAEVTIFTTDVYTARHAELVAAADPALPPPGVEIVFVPEPTPEETEVAYTVMHPYSARVLDALKAHYGSAPPELIEFCDYLGEGFVTLQAAHTLDPFLARTHLAVRIHTTAELCDLLNGYCPSAFSARAIYEFERFCLRHADHVIFQGGDILATYERFYGAAAIAPATRIRYPFTGPSAGPDPDFDPSGRPLSLLYLGRLERRKGVLALAGAVAGLPREDLSLTFAGADTTTAPLGGSVAANLELAIADDPRMALLGGVHPTELPALIRAHDVIVIPSAWECWPYAALEPLHLNRPVLATPVGGLVEIVQGGVSGWQAAGTDAAALEEALITVLEDRAGLAEMVVSGAPLAHARSLAPDQEILDAYRRLLATPLTRPVAAPARPAAPDPTAAAPADPARPRAAEVPLVSAIVPYFQAEAHVRATVDSLLAQTHPRMEIVLVNDGSFTDADWILAELSARFPVLVVTQMNQGLGAARNFGIGQSVGPYILPLDADNVIAPDFTARAVAVLEARPEVAYVTPWSRYIGTDGNPWPEPNVGYAPLGNWSSLLVEDNVAGDAAALWRRRLFDLGFRYSEELTSFEDWALYRHLAAAGHHGAVIPERLLGYRLRDDSMQATVARPHRARLLGEINAHVRARGMRWTA
ncbi:glycosyltransferase [Conexibacter sp. DBS9H8]|uniref:glycosyltransferase n=1 Tax=Conexibacter sp. DBS9H8 TaxID=2937801 RepID=UPI00200FBF8C|nr:glycosyltransferase [Conexibacter sp. DBS9H8]